LREEYGSGNEKEERNGSYNNNQILESHRFADNHKENAET